MVCNKDVVCTVCMSLTSKVQELESSLSSSSSSFSARAPLTQQPRRGSHSFPTGLLPRGRRFIPDREGVKPCLLFVDANNNHNNNMTHHCVPATTTVG